MVVELDPADFCYRCQCLSNNARPGSTRRRRRQFAGSAINVTALRVDAIINTALNADSQRDTIRGFAYDRFYGLQLVQLSMGVRQSGCRLHRSPSERKKVLKR
jgi:hypothetical protein